jgi:hypothetical protein
MTYRETTGRLLLGVLLAIPLCAIGSVPAQPQEQPKATGTGGAGGADANASSTPSSAPPSSALANTTNFPESVVPGQTVAIGGDFDPAKPDAVINIYAVGTDTVKHTVNGKAGPKSIALKLPDDLEAPGRYYLTVDYDGLSRRLVPGELRVVAKVQLNSTHPTTAYQDSNGTFHFEVIGQNFSENPQDDQIYIGGDPKILAAHRFNSAEDCKAPANFPCLWVESSEKLHVVGYKSDRYQGPLLLSVKVGSAWSAQKQLVLSRMSETGVLVTSLAIFGILALILYFLVARGMRDNVIDGQHYSAFWSLFLDKQTNSYSLSKFQLLMFSAVFAFGYLYVFLCSWLVQWHFVLPDVPSSFSAILAMSAGTTVAAAGVTATRGSKGAGGPRPSAADFVTTGGQVVPERFQFFIWTLIACFGFVALLVSQDPSTIDKFPDFPQGLLYVMGVSAGGYLAGKVGRAAGPVLRNIAWRPADSAVKIEGTGKTEADLYLGEITIQGENLSSDGDFTIDGVKLPIDPTAKGNLVTPTPQDQASDRSFSSQLKIRITQNANVELSAGDHVFRIINKDAQFAEIRFTADSPVIATVLPKGGLPHPPPDAPDANKVIAAGKEQVELLVTGSGFRLGTTARWTPANAEPADLAPGAVVLVDAKTLRVTLVPGDPGSGTLLVSTPSGFSASATVTIVDTKGS